MGRWDNKLPTDTELVQLLKLNRMNTDDFDKFEKLQGDGEFKRLDNVKEFLNKPSVMRKYQRKKKIKITKAKRKCRCKK